jgi:FkbM family methyltransferase
VSTANLASWYNRLRLLRGQVPVSFPAASPSVSADLMVDKNHIRVTTLGEWLHLFEAHGFLVRSTHGCAAYFEPWHGTAKIAAARLVGRFFERHPPLADLVLWVAVKPSASPAGVLSQRPQVTPDWGRAAPAAWRLARGLMALPRFKGRDRLLLALRRYMKPPEGPVTIPLPDGTMVRGHLGDEIDAQLYVYRTYEPITSGVLRQCVNSGDTVLDVGANIGVHTLALAGKVGAKGSVHAFEPNPGTFERLVQNVNVNAFTNVRLNQLALGADESEVQLVQQWSNRSGDAMLVPGGADVQHEGGSAGSNGAVFTVRQTTLDAYCQEHGVTPALLKVDVEGGEMNVLRGAQRVLGAVRPTLLVEYNARTARKHGNDPGAVFSWLEQQFNYELFFVNDAGLEPYAHVLPRLDPSSASGNVLCLRSEEAALVSARINAHYPEVPRSHAALELWPPE